ncbi:hypothetical protein [Microtetraspora sp. NBRC 16547]|uniref:hypothetical protein n=1 Tax=Microtetraspora sp. NBRC 16547 TaxID=3030993 RepID=UPI0024A5E97C|nr:hypothetical protein [Microtetraspora sp. NBRC 16547]GLW98185.1 hypothetical protein Misp02_22720 [Microtetraspora sp. NBRC 16547]
MNGLGNINSILALFGEMRTTDVLVPGYIDHDDEPPSFHPWTVTAYFALENAMVRMDSVQNYSQLKLSVVDEMAVPDEILREEEQFAVASYSHLFFADAYESFRCTQVRYVEDESSDASQAIVQCIEFVFEDNWPVFVDPEWHFGVRLEGAGGLDRWLESNSPQNSRLVTWCPS